MNRSLVRFASGILSLLLATCAVASGPALVITDSGYQLMTIGADGKAVLQDIAKVVDLRVTPGPDVPGPDDPKPPVDAPTSTSKRIKEMSGRRRDLVGNGQGIGGSETSAVRVRIDNQSDRHGFFNRAG
jgi:hypothetical protein